MPPRCDQTGGTHEQPRIVRRGTPPTMLDTLLLSIALSIGLLLVVLLSSITATRLGGSTARCWGAPGPRALAVVRRNCSNNDSGNDHDGPEPPLLIEWRLHFHGFCLLHRREVLIPHARRRRGSRLLVRLGLPTERDGPFQAQHDCQHKGHCAQGSKPRHFPACGLHNSPRHDGIGHNGIHNISFHCHQRSH